MNGPSVYAPEYLRNQKDETLHGIADMIERQMKSRDTIEAERDRYRDMLEAVRSQICWEADRRELPFGFRELLSDIRQTLAPTDTPEGK